MSTPGGMRGAPHDIHHPPEDRAPLHAGHTVRGHGWMMWLMCLPMVTFAVVLMTTTSAGAAALLPAILCIAMMALMMGMHGRNRGQ